MKRGSRGGRTKRWVLRAAGASLVAAGTSTFGWTRAFSQGVAERAVSVGTADDGSALLGLDVTSSVQAGRDGQRLVDLTNNTDEPLDVTLSLVDPGQGSLPDPDVSLASGATHSVDVSVSADSPTGTGALAFEVVAAGETTAISLTRAVDVTEPPALDQRIYDQTKHSNVAYTVAYGVSNVPDFDRVEITVENVDAGYIGPETYVERSTEGTVSYPPGGGSDGGAGGDTYEFRFRVYDASGEITDLYTEVSDTADANDPPGDDLGDEDDPELVGFTVANDEQYTNNRFTVDYEVDRLDEFQEVQVAFDNTENDWSDVTKTSGDAPTGTVVYPDPGERQGGVNGDTFEVTVDVYDQSGIPVDSGTVSIDAGSNETVEWP